MESLVGFWTGKKVFVTGHTGFKGSWLSLLLTRLGAEVHGYALSPLAGSTFERARVEEALETSVIGDVRDYDVLARVVKQVSPDIVLHLAAQPLVRESYRTPIETYATNVMGTVHMLEAIRNCDTIRSAVMVTSDKCYENQEWVWGYRENEPMGGADPYSNSKGCAELVTSAYRRSYFETGARIASGRAGNVIGGGDVSQDRLVPDVINAMREGRSPVIRFPNAVRPWQHVLEPLLGYLQLAEALFGADGDTYADGWNFGPSEEGEQNVRNVVDTLCEAWGTPGQWVLDENSNPHEAGFLKLDSAKARRRLGWTPRLDFRETIRWTADWYKHAMSEDDMSDFTRAQIVSYLENNVSA